MPSVPVAREQNRGAVASPERAREPRRVSRFALVVPELPQGAVLRVEEPEPSMDGVLGYLIDEETERTLRRPAVGVDESMGEIPELRSHPLRVADGIDLDGAHEVVLAGVVPAQVAGVSGLPEVVGDGLFPHVRTVFDLERQVPAVGRPPVGGDLSIEPAVTRARHHADRGRADQGRPDPLLARSDSRARGLPPRPRKGTLRRGRKRAGSGTRGRRRAAPSLRPPSPRERGFPRRRISERFHRESRPGRKRLPGSVPRRLASEPREDPDRTGRFRSQRRLPSGRDR